MGHFTNDFISETIHMYDIEMAHESYIIQMACKWGWSNATKYNYSFFFFLKLKIIFGFQLKKCEIDNSN